jgi:hypothetical protein
LLFSGYNDTPNPPLGSGTATSHPGVVVKVDHAAFETAFVQKFELEVDVVG